MTNFEEKNLRALEQCGHIVIRWTFHPHKNSQNCCHQTRFLGSKYTENKFAAGVPLRTPLGSLQRSPDTLAAFKGAASRQRQEEREGNEGVGREKGGRDGEGRAEDGREEGYGCWGMDAPALTLVSVAPSVQWAFQ